MSYNLSFFNTNQIIFLCPFKDIIFGKNIFAY